MTQTSEPAARAAALVLTTVEGVVFGALPALPVSTPWWQDVAPVVAAFRERYGFEAVILRLLEAERAAPPGGQVTYLAQTDRQIAAAPWAGEIGDHPLRLAYARPGGPAADLAWARARMAELGLMASGPPVQIRTWNLSSLWRLPVQAGAVWLKVVPPFFAHEGAILAHLAAEAVPKLLAHENGRVLMAETAGQDLYQATPDQLAAMIDLLVDLQARRLGRADELLALGLPDWRADALCAWIAEVAERTAPRMTGQEARIGAFVGTLPQRLAAIAGCGPGETLVHSDFHPGNFRGDGGRLTLLDWGDCGVGHPLLDQSSFLGVLAAAEREAARRHWRDRWLKAAPGMDFDRAVRLIAPVAAARRAAVFQGFLDAIEPSEHPYHAADPVLWLSRALDLADANDL